jgi:hypothetical protein
MNNSECPNNNNNGIYKGSSSNIFGSTATAFSASGLWKNISKLLLKYSFECNSEIPTTLITRETNFFDF